LSLCAQFHLVTTMIAGIGNGAMKPSDGSEIFIALAVIAPAAVLMAILVYGIIDPEYKTWFARKCVSVLRQLQSCATCCAPSDRGSTNGEECDSYYEVTFTAPKLGLCLTQRPGEQHVVVTKSAGSSHEAGVQEGDLLLAVAGQHIPKSEQGMQAAAQSMIDGAAQPLLMRFKRHTESTSGEADGNSHVMNVSPEQGVSNRNRRHLVASNPVNIGELETRFSKMRAVADEHDGVSRDLAENEEDLTSSNVSVVLTQCDI